MPETINQVQIFLPVLAVVALTLTAFFLMGAARGKAAKEPGRDPRYYRAFIGEPEPEYAIVAVRHYGNLFEMPVLFYVAALSLFGLGAVSGWALLWAWGYALCRIAQSAVHMSYNNPLHRGLSFVVGNVFIVALWVTVALAVFARL